MPRAKKNNSAEAEVEEKLPPSQVPSSSLSEPPAVARRRKLESALGATNGTPFVGLRNLGSTCYMNSLLQTMFMTPELRQHILAWEFEPKQQHSKNVAFQLQLLFARMQNAHLRSVVNPKPLVQSFGMGDEAHRQQHDVQELNRVLLDVLQDCVDRAKGHQIVQQLYHGSFLDYNQCAHCKFRSSSTVPFLDMTLPITGCSTLNECVAKSLIPDLIEGLHCEKCDAKHDRLKGMSLHTLPNVLCIQLARMDYNVASGRREKLFNDIELPLQMDLSHFVENSDERALAEMPTSFSLFAIIAQRGNAYHGHYYCFVKVGADRWIKFDDDRVTVAMPDEVLEYINPAQWKIEEAARRKKEFEEKQRSLQKERTAATDSAASAAVPLPHTIDLREGAAAPIEEPRPSPAPIPASAENNSPCSTPKAMCGTPPKMSDVASDSEADIGNLFDDTPFSSTAAGGGVSCATGGVLREAKVSGESYYVIYRADPPNAKLLQKVDFSVPFDVPNSVKEILSGEETQLAQMAAELSRLRDVVSIGIHLDGTKYWVEAKAGWTVLHLANVFFSSVLSDEKRADLGGAAPPSPLWRLRAYNVSLSVLSESYSDDMTLADIGFNAESSCYGSFGVERRFAGMASVPWPRITQCDIALALWFFDAEVQQFRPFTKPTTTGAAAPPYWAWPMTLYADSTIGDMKVLIRHLVGIEEEKQCIVISSSHAEETLVPFDTPLSTPLSSFKVASQDSVYVELRPTDVEPQSKDGWRPMAIEHLVLGRMVTIVATVKGSADAAPKSITTAIDGRKTMLELKSCLCKMAQLEVASSQLLTDGSTKELKNLSCISVKAMAYGTKDLRVTIQQGKEERSPGDFFVDVFEAVPNNYINPVRFLRRVASNKTTTLTELLRRATEPIPSGETGEAFAAPADLSLVRFRLMQPRKTASLGLPLYKPVLHDNFTSAHHLEEIRVVLQRIDEPEEVTKDTLILNVHLWRSDISDHVAAFGVGQELLTFKGCPASAVVEAASTILNIPTSELAMTRAKFYQVQSHDSVFNLNWEHLQSETFLPRSVGFYPHKFEMDDILLCHRTSEPWMYVKAPRTKHAPAKKGQAAAVGRSMIKVAEPGISIRSVWEEECEPEPGAEEQQQAANADGAPQSAEDEQPQQQRARIVDSSQLEVHLFQAKIHRQIDEQCRICFVDYETNDAVNILPCHHMFHKECLSPWLAEHDTCPQCLDRIA